MGYLTKHRSAGYMGGVTILVLLVLSMLIRCAPVESPEQMQKDIGGLTDAQKMAIMAPMQHKLYPGRLPE